MRGARTAVLIALAIATLASASGSLAATRVYPGCGSTLRACAGAARAGDRILLRTDNVVHIPNNWSMKKGLRFLAAPGYRPRLEPKTGDGFIDVEPTESPATVGFRGIRFTNVNVGVSFSAGSGHRSYFDDNVVVVEHGGTGFSTYYYDTSAGSITMRNNTLKGVDSGTDSRIQGGTAIITGNRIRGSRSASSGYVGIVLHMGAGTVRATIASNAMHNVQKCECGIDSGLLLNAFDTAVASVEVLNNTIDDVGRTGGSGGTSGLELRVADAATMDAAVYGNLVTNVDGPGIRSNDAPGLTVHGNRNDVSSTDANQLGSYDFGTLLNVDPEYLGEAHGDLRLQTSSPLIDAGQTCIASTPLPRADAAGQFRLAGTAVEIGAYERGSTISGSVPGRNESGTDTANTIQGTGGRDVLCGLDGDDTIRGKGGGDFVYGGDGADHLFGGGGPDVARGEAGADHIDLRDGVRRNDVAYGGPDMDVCLTDTGDRRHGCL
jgi:hypothetical protein